VKFIGIAISSLFPEDLDAFPLFAVIGSSEGIVLVLLEQTPFLALWGVSSADAESA